MTVCLSGLDWLDTSPIATANDNAQQEVKFNYEIPKTEQ